MKESIFQKGEAGPSIAKRVAEIKEQPSTVGSREEYYREAKPDAKHEVYAATAHVIRATHEGVHRLLHNQEEALFLNQALREAYAPYQVTDDIRTNWPITFTPPEDFQEFERNRFITVLTNAQNLYPDLFLYTFHRNPFNEGDAQVFRGLQTVIGQTEYHGAAENRIESFLMPGVMNASSDIWGAYLALAYEHQKEFSTPMTAADFQEITKDLSRIFLKLSLLKFDVLLALMLAQKKERKVSTLIGQHDAEADVERYRRMLRLHRKEGRLHVDVDLDYLESFTKDIQDFRPDEKRYGCPARNAIAIKENGEVKPVIPDLVEFYAQVASVTLPQNSEKLAEAFDFYNENREESQKDPELFVKRFFLNEDI